MSEIEEPPTGGPAGPSQPPITLEAARSGRSRCKVCRKAIAEGDVRLGLRVEGPYGEGYLWHHLHCAARQMTAKVEAAYQARVWEHGGLEEGDLPPLADLRAEGQKAQAQKAARRRPPYAERAPSGRSRCKHSGETIPKGAWRVVLGREVQFGSQKRTSPIHVLPRHVAEALAAEDCATPREGLEEALTRNSGLEAAELREVLDEIGPL